MAEDTATAEALPLSVDSIDSIPESYRSLYAEKDGKFAFQTPEALLSAKAHEKQKRQEIAAERDTYKGKLTEYEQQLEAIKQEKMLADAKKTGDYSKLKESFEQKAVELEGTYKGQLSAKDELIKKLTVGQEATKLAAKLFGEDADTLRHIVDSRLTVEVSDGQANVIVLDAKGNPSAKSLDELHDEIYNDPRYSRFVVGSNASGGGANGSSSKGGGANQKTISGEEFRSLPEAERKKLWAEGYRLTSQ